MFGTRSTFRRSGGAQIHAGCSLIMSGQLVDTTPKKRHRGADMETTLGRATVHYIDSRWSRGEISKETKRSFTETLRLFAEVLGRDRPLRGITRRDIEKWLGSMSCASATVRLRLSTVKGFFQWCVIEGFARVDPTLGIRGPKKTRSVPRGLADEDAALVVKGAADARERLILVLMLEEGLRAGGVAGLQLGDIDFRNETIVVTEKGGHSRILPLTPTCRRAIEDYLVVRGRSAGPLLLTYQRSYAQHDDGLSARYIARVASAAIKRAGIAESGHALRHSFAHGLIDAGATIRELQDALGHASIATTQVYMAHAQTTQLRGLMGHREYGESA